MKKFLILAMAAMGVLTWARPAHSAWDSGKLNRLESIEIEHEDGSANVNLKFAREWNKRPRPVFYKKSIQMDIEGAFITPARREFKLNDGGLAYATANQINPTTVRVRLFTSEDSRSFADTWGGSTAGKAMILSLNKSVGKSQPDPKAEAKERSIEKPAPEKPAPVKTVAVEEPTESEQAKPQVDLPALAAETPKEESKTAPADGERTFSFLAKPVHAATTEKAPDEASKGGARKLIAYEAPKAPEAPSMQMMALKMVGSLALVLSLVFALSWLAKKYMGKINGVFGGGNVVKVLATGSIGMKKQIAVVDVAGEVIILGIAGDNITMLTHVDNQDNADRLRRLGGPGQPSSGAGYATADFGDFTSQNKSGALKKALDALRIGRVRASAPVPPALLDDSDPLTFAGNLAGLREKAPMTAPKPAPKIEVRDEVSFSSPGAGREELLKRVTSAIRAKNGNLGIA
ncbi:MAG: flagellar biosynthetic protein FliO [Nitrospinae bacterium]|nr:flagellar biosynthetic protein FliO [Nitrospinota bacterium]